MIKAIHRSICRVSAELDKLMQSDKGCHCIDHTACLVLSSRLEHIGRTVKSTTLNYCLYLRVICQNSTYTVSTPAVTEEYNGKIRDLITCLHKGYGMIKIDNSLGNSAKALSLALIHCRGIIRKNIISVRCKIVRTIHIGIVSASAESVGKHHYPMLIFTRTVEISCKHLSLVRGKRILSALESFKVLYPEHQWLRAVGTYADI